MLACLLSSLFELPNPHHTSPDPSHDLTDTSCTPTVVDATLARTECYKAPESSSQSHAFAEEPLSCVTRVIEEACAIAALGGPAGIVGPGLRRRSRRPCPSMH